MSEFSEEIRTTVEKINHSVGGEEFIEVNESGIADRTTGFKSARQYFDVEALKVIRRIYRRSAGRRWETGRKAMDETEPDCVPALAAVLGHAFCAALLVGQGLSHAVKKHAFMGTIDEVFENESFKAETELMYMNTVLEDPDVAQVMRDYLRITASHVASAGGFLIANERNTIRVWDVWNLGSQSAVMGMYICGYEIGKRWSEQDVLQGILSATEEKHDG